jgi:hypothetical protein
MTTYKGINGFAVQSVATDPSPLDEGQVWYNNASYAFKLAAVTTVGTWASGGSLNTTRWLLGGVGLQTAALGFGGYDGGVLKNNTESYNGTSWTTVNSLNQSRAFLAGSGASNSSALAFGGNDDGPTNYSSTELWNGTSWTANPTGLATARSNLAGCGTQTLALAFGGSPTGAATEEWTGTVLATRTITTS